MTSLPAWSQATGTAGSVAIWLALVCFALAAGLQLFGHASDRSRRIAQLSFTLGCAGFLAAFVALASLFIGNQYGYNYVFRHSALDHEFKYKLAGVWSGQEGSFLLWGVTSAIFGLFAVRKTGADRRWFTVIYSLFLAALAGILSYESPFALVPGLAQLPGLPPDGRGLHPSLLNYWVTIHPPTIFCGFGSLTILFAWAMSALIRRDYTDWVDGVRPWAILSVTLLGVGLCMGGFWAYETLGWGGFWMWDPVENTSFVPWVFGAALLHGIFIQKARGTWKIANAVLACLPFLSFLYGTFLTRSGFLGDTSVHSFAEMDRSALRILIGLGGVAIVGFLVFLIRAWRQPPAASPAPTDSWMNRAAMYTSGVWILLAMGVITGVGMSVPLIQSLASQKPKMVEEHLYHMVLAWPFPFLMLLIAVAPFVSWRGTSAKELFGKLANCLAVSIGVVGFLLLWLKSGKWGQPADLDAKVQFPAGIEVSAVFWVLFLTWLCLFAVTTNGLRLIQSFRRAKGSLGAFVTHVGVAMTMLGLIFSRGFEQKEMIVVHDAKAPSAFGSLIELKGPTSLFTDRKNKIEMQVTGPGGTFVARPGLYYTIGNDGDPAPISWPHIQRHPLYDMYFTVYEMVYEATEPATFSVGRTMAFEGMTITYEGLKTAGQAGMAGATFTADLKVVDGENEIRVAPSIMIAGEGEIKSTDARLNDDYIVRLERIDAADKSAIISIRYAQPAYPVEVFYKPLTSLVWLGVGIMTLGGFLAAWSRRRIRPDAASPEPTQDAPAPTAEV